MTEAQLKKFIPRAALHYCPEVSHDNETGYEVTFDVHPDFFDDLDALAKLGVEMGFDLSMTGASEGRVYISWR